MNVLFSTCLLFCSMIPFLGSLEGNLAQSDDRVQVGSRLMTQAERVKIQEERALRDERMKNGSFDAEFVERIENDQGESIDGEALMGMGCDKSIFDFTRSYTSTHDGAYHKLVSVGAIEKTIELEDGSIWRVKSDDCYKTMNWSPKHTIVITPNHHWFSIYDFRLRNQDTETSVAANLSFAPIYSGIKTHWINVIDEYSRTILLEDGSIWNASCFDDSIIKKWKANDTIIIGINDSWFAGKRRNILINVDMLNYAACNCINGKSVHPVMPDDQ